MIDVEPRRWPEVALPASPPKVKPPPVPVEIATLLSNARLLAAHGEAELALNLLRVAANRDSHNPAVLAPLAHLLEKLDRNDEAVIVRRALGRLDFGFATTRDLAHALYRQGADDEALVSYYDALAVVGDEAAADLFDIHKNMGNIFVRRGDWDSAEESYNRAHALNSRSDVLLVNRGTLEIQRGGLQQALDYFRLAVEMNPRNDGAWTGLALIHAEFGDLELAWGGLERALDLNPGNRTAVLTVGHWAARDHVPQRAIARLEEFLASHPDDDEISLLLVHLFCVVGQLGLAAIETERVLAWQPERSDVRKLKLRLEQEGNPS